MATQAIRKNARSTVCGRVVLVSATGMWLFLAAMTFGQFQ
jgi:hypothetical protein